MSHVFGNIFTCILILALSWQALAQDVLQKELLLSTPRSSFTSVEADGKIYLAGGFTNRNQASSTIDVFDIATQTWNNTMSLPSPRSYVTPVVVSPHVYFFGGQSSNFSTVAFQYDSSSVELQATPILDMVQPIQASIYGSTLTLVGSAEVRILNITNKQDGWTSNPDIDNIMNTIVGTVVFSHENWIFIFGGVNMSSRQPVSDAWVFDIETSNLTRYDDAVNPIGYVNTRQFTLAATNNIMSAWRNTGDCILFNIASSTWLNITIMNITNVMSVPGFTFIFTSSGYYTVDWNNPHADPEFSSIELPIITSAIYGEHVAYFVNYPLYATMYCFNNGSWTSANTTAVASTVATLEWPSYGYVFATVDGVYLFNNCSVKFVTQPRIRGAVLSLPAGDQLFVIAQGIDVLNYYTYNGTLAVIDSSVTRILPQLCFDNIFYNFSQGLAYSILTIGYVNILTNTGSTFSNASMWTVQGNYFFVTNAGGVQTQASDQVDIYNYKTDTWLNSTSFPYPDELQLYTQAFNMNNLLTVFTSTRLVTYDISTNQWNAQSLNPDDYILPESAIGPMVLDVDDIVYTTTNILRLRIVTNGTIDVRLITDQHSPAQLIHNEQSNQLMILTAKKWIYTWNIDDQQIGVFLFPRPKENNVMIVTSGSILLASSADNDAYDYCYLKNQNWDTVPGLTSYVHPSVMTPVTIGDNKFILIAGGTDKVYGFSSNSVRLVDVSVLEALVTPETNPNTSPESSSQEDNTVLIVAIVIPVGAVIIAGAPLAFFLIRRQKKRKDNRGNRMSTIGLEQQYGQWFIPFSDLTFHEQLGQGGSGQVFKGSWKNTSVALKLSMTQAHSSVISELALMMQLRPHPNVVQLLGFSVHPETDSIVLVIEYCNGGALDSVLFDGKTVVSMKQKLEWLIGISKGLSHLHSNNIVHRDIAARNVLLHQNEAKITDFGMSRIVDDQQQRGTTKSELGPIRWMSPESLARKEYSVKSDVWSFGIVAYEIIAQQEPHLDRDPIQVGQEIRDSGLTPQLHDTCPSELASVIKSCWNMEPSQRPTFEHIIAQLENIH